MVTNTQRPIQTRPWVGRNFLHKHCYTEWWYKPSVCLRWQRMWLNLIFCFPKQAEHTLIRGHANVVTETASVKPVWETINRSPSEKSTVTSQAFGSTFQRLVWTSGVLVDQILLKGIFLTVEGQSYACAQPPQQARAYNSGYVTWHA